jgi:hypothetical protein
MFDLMLAAGERAWLATAAQHWGVQSDFMQDCKRSLELENRALPCVSVM